MEADLTNLVIQLQCSYAQNECIRDIQGETNNYKRLF